MVAARHAADHPHAVVSQVLAQREQLPLRFFLSAGEYEGPHPGSDSILRTMRDRPDVLEARGHPLIHCGYASGHDYVMLRGAPADGMLALVGTRQRWHHR